MNDDDELDAKIDAFAKTTAIKARTEVQHVGVFPVETTPFDEQYHFGYTVGRLWDGKPEIIVTGMSSSSESTLRLAAFFLDEEHAPIGKRHETQDGYFVTFAPVPDPVARKHCAMATYITPWVRAVQFIWQDAERRWPWEPGHLAHEAVAAGEPNDLPVLAGPDWRPTC